MKDLGAAKQLLQISTAVSKDGRVNVNRPFDELARNPIFESLVNGYHRSNVLIAQVIH